jgi:ribosomal protein L40E
MALARAKCSRCGAANGSSQAYCRACHAAYMREFRKTHPLTEAQLLQALEVIAQRADLLGKHRQMLPVEHS